MKIPSTVTITDVDQVGPFIAQLRQLANMSQRDLAQEAGMRQSQVSTLERGAKRPSVETLLKVFGALGVTLKVELYPEDES